MLFRSKVADEVSEVPDFLTGAFAKPIIEPARPQSSATGFHTVGPQSDNALHTGNTQPFAPAARPDAFPSIPTSGVGKTAADPSAARPTGRPTAASDPSRTSSGESARVPAADAKREGESGGRHEKKSGRILPWFLQDNDNRSQD